MRSLLVVAFVALLANTALAQADLTVTSFSGKPNPCNIYGATQVSVTIKNIGNQNADSCWVDLYHNRDFEPEPFEDGDQYSFINSLSPQQEVTITFTVTGPTSVATWLVWVQVDSYLQCNESNENNNSSSYSQNWTDTPLSISSFKAHGDTGMIVIEYKLGGSIGLLAAENYPQIITYWKDLSTNLWYDVSAQTYNKHIPDAVDGKSYCTVWNSRATAKTENVNADGIIMLSVNLGNGYWATQSSTKSVYNSPEAIKQRRSLWITDTTFDDVRLTILDLLENTNDFQNKFLDFCANPAITPMTTSTGDEVVANTNGKTVRFATLYFTLWCYEGNTRIYILDNAERRQQLRTFINAAHTRGIRVFAAIDQAYHEWVFDPFNESGKFFDVINDIKTFNLFGGDFDGVLMNVEFDFTNYPPIIYEPIWQTNWTQLVQLLKYRDEDAPFSGLELRIGAAHSWDSYLTDDLMPWVDSVFLQAYDRDAQGACVKATTELSAGAAQFINVELGLETQQQKNLIDGGTPQKEAEIITYQGNGGKVRLEKNADDLFDKLTATQQKALLGYGIFFYQAYVDLENDMPTEEDKGGPCNIFATTSGGGGSLLVLVIVTLILLRRRVYHGKHLV